MQKYLKIHTQFIEFLETNGDKIYDANEIKLINLILDNFALIAGSDTAAGKSAKIINELIQTKAAGTSEVLSLNKDDENSPKAQHLVRLISLETEKFRGFTEKCIFNLEKQFNLVQHPDEFISNLINLDRTKAENALQNLIKSLRKLPTTRDKVLSTF
jgi:hypothetical protein